MSHTSDEDGQAECVPVASADGVRLSVMIEEFDGLSEVCANHDESSTVCWRKDKPMMTEAKVMSEKEMKTKKRVWTKLSNGLYAWRVRGTARRTKLNQKLLCGEQGPQSASTIKRLPAKMGEITAKVNIFKPGSLKEKQNFDGRETDNGTMESESLEDDISNGTQV